MGLTLAGRPSGEVGQWEAGAHLVGSGSQPGSESPPAVLWLLQEKINMQNSHEASSVEAPF